MPILFSLSPETAAAFPETRVELVVAQGLRNDESWPETVAARQRLQDEHQAGSLPAYDEADPRIASWYQAYRDFGSNPRRTRSSVDALSRRFAKSGLLPAINSAVDAYNYVSVRFGLPAGAFDLDRLGGPVVVRPARAGDSFTPLGEPDVVEEPKPGEVVYAIGSQVLTRHWNHRDSDHSKVTETSSRAVFLLERVSSAAVPDPALAQARDELLRLVAEHADSVSTCLLDGQHLEAQVG